VRKFTWDFNYDYHGPGRTLESRKIQGVPEPSGDGLFVEVANLHEKLDEPFAIESAAIPVGVLLGGSVQHYSGPSGGVGLRHVARPVLQRHADGIAIERPDSTSRRAPRRAERHA
jgi:hypothetical protein